MRVVPEAERRHPPTTSWLPGTTDHLAHAIPRVANEGRRALELSGAGRAGRLTRDGDDVEATLLDVCLDRVDHRRDGRPPEVQVGDVKDRQLSGPLACASRRDER